MLPANTGLDWELEWTGGGTGWNSALGCVGAVVAIGLKLLFIGTCPIIGLSLGIIGVGVGVWGCSILCNIFIMSEFMYLFMFYFKCKN